MCKFIPLKEKLYVYSIPSLTIFQPMNAHQNNPYSPFPPEIRGRHCEIVEDDYLRLISIHYVKYDKDQVARAKSQGFYEDTNIKKYLYLVEGEIDERNLYFIYKIESFRIKRNLLPQQDDWKFYNSIEDYVEYGFVDLNELDSFCQYQWGVNLSNFVTIDKTCLPN